MRMRKKATSILLVLSMLVTLFASGLTSFAASSLDVKFSNNGNAETSSSTIYANFQVTNNGSSDVNLADLKLRYYYTKDSDAAQNFYCDHAAITTPSGVYNAVTSNVKGTYVNMSQATSTADTYLEVSFTSGSIPAGGTLVVQTRTARSDWSNYNMSNDYSFAVANSYVNNDKVTAYLNGSLVSGQEPGGTTPPPTYDPTISPTAGTFDKNAPADLSVTLTANGNTFKGIKGLTSGTDYTVSGSKVTISKNYLSKLANGTYNLEFDFGVTNNPKYTVTVKSTPITEGLKVKIGTAEGKKGDIVTVPITFADVAKVNNVGTFNFYVGYDKSLLEAISVEAGSIVVNPSVNFSTKIDSTKGTISFVFLDNTIGDELITKDGVLANIKFKILGNSDATVKFNDGGAFGDGNMSKISNISFTDGKVSILLSDDRLGVTIGTTTGKTGETVTVPVTFKDVAKVGNVGTFNFYVGYDSALLKATKVEAGSIVKNAAVNFSTKIDATKGTISFVFLDNTIGDELITEDGVLANITFEIIGTQDGTAVVKFNEGGAFGDGNMSKISSIKFTDGSVVIDNGGIVTPTAPEITPTNVTFDLAAPADVNVTLKANGNTFNGITGLTKGTDYTVSGDKVTISKNYLSTLTVNTTKQLTFDFGVASNPVLTVKVIKSVIDGSDLNVAIGTATGKTGETVTVPVTMANVAKVGNVGTFNFYVGYDSALLKATKVEAGDIVKNAAVNFSTKIDTTKGTISFVFLDNTIGDELITSDGVLANITFEIIGKSNGTAVVKFNEGGAFGDGNMSKISTVKFTNGSVVIDNGDSEESDLNVKIGTATGKTGETVTVPVTMANVAKVGNVGTFNFYVGYDSALLKATKVEAGSIVKNAAVNFSTKIDATKGTISFVFLDNTIGDELITEDGVLANITFEIIGTQDGTAVVKFNEGGAFGDGNMSKISTVKFANGSVVIDNGGIVVPTAPEITPTNVTFDLAAPADVNVTLKANGNTFNGITGLTKGTDYTVSGDKVTISKNYLSTLTVNTTKQLTFDFGVDNNPVLAVKVIKSVIEGSDLNVKIGTATGKTGDLVVVPITMANVAKVGNVGTFNFYVGYDNTLLEATKVEAGDIVKNAAVNFSTKIDTAKGTISFVFLDNTIGDELITEDGVLANITFKVLSHADATAVVKFNEGGAFGDGNMAKITALKFTNGSVIIDGDEILPPSITPTAATFDKNAPADVKVTLAPNGNEFKGIVGLTEGTDYTVSGNNVTILKSYLSGLALGSKDLTFDFGTDTIVLKLTIINSEVVVPSGNLGVTIGKAAGVKGDVITVPITFANVKEMGNVGTFNFYVGYDSTLLKATKVEAGSIVVNPAVNFSTQIKDGKISFVFLDNTIGDELITSDGVLATITFEVLGQYKQTTPIVFNEGGAFGDGNMAKITKIVFTPGSVDIDGEELPAQPATISPDAVIFDKYAPADIKITLTPNGNTFAGITGLTKGTDYTVSGNTVTLLKSYLSKQSIGTKSLTFDFGTANNPVLLVTIVDTTPQVSNDLVVMFHNNNLATSGSTIVGNYKIVNKSTSAVNLADVKVRYYFTSDSSAADTFYCDHAAVTDANGGNYNAITSAVKGSFVKMNSTASNADTYLEISFSSGSIPAGGSVEIQTRVAKADWSNYNMSNDYSYKAAGAYTEWDTITAYKNGTLVFGKEPGSTIDIKPASINPTTATFDKYAPKDIVVTMTPNGNTFAGITGLTSGTHYTVSGNTVTIKSSYLATLTTGTTKILTFNFGTTNNPTLTVSVKDSTPILGGLNVAIGTATGKAGDVVTVPITFADVAKAGNVGTFNFYVGYDKSLLQAVSVEAGSIVKNAAVNFSTQINSTNGTISFVFLDNTIGDELITEDGVVANIKFKVLGTKKTTTAVSFKEGGAFGDANMSKIVVNFKDGSVNITEGDVVDLDVTIGTATGKAGDVVTVPVTFADVAKVGNVGTFNFYVGYDKSLLQAVSVEAGSIVKNAAVNFSTQINSTNGTISFVFLDNTIGDELITEDGVLANIKFKVLGTKATTTTVSFKEGGAFGDGNMSKISDINFTNGSVKITVGDVADLDVTIGTATGKAGDVVTVPVTFADVAKVGNVGTFNFYVGYDKSLLQAVSVEAGSIVKNAAVNFSTQINSTNGTISFVFLDNTIGDELITEDGVLANIKFKVLGTKATTTTVKFNEGGAFGDGNMSKISDVNFTNGSVKITVGDIADLDVTIGTATGTAGDVVTVPVTFADVAKVGNVGTFNFYIGYDNKQLEAVSVEAGDIVVNPAVNFSTKIDNANGKISFVFLDNTIGDELITTDGVLANIKFKVVGTTATTTVVKFNEGGAFGDGNMSKISDINFKDGSVTITAGPVVDLDVAIGTATGKAGDVVTVPVTFADVAKVGNVGTFNFYVGYDSALLKATKVEAGSIVKNAAVNFSTKIDASKGTISFVFLDNTIGDELITEDGVLANITFEILGTKETTTVVKFNEGGAFGDGNMSKIANVNFANGSVSIKEGVVVQDPTISPVSATFDKYTPADIKVTLSANGNTFAGITGLKNGTDYTVSGSTVTISKNYLANLALGVKEFTFDFGSAKNPVLKVTVTDSTPQPTENLKVTIGTATGKAGDVVTVPVTIQNVAKVGNVGTCNFYIGYDSSLLKATKVTAGDVVVNAPVNFSTKIDATKGTISFVFLDNTIGDELIATDGVLANITFEVLGTKETTAVVKFNEGGAFGDGNMSKISNVELANGSVAIEAGAPVATGLVVAIDKVNAAGATTVTVPVTLKNVAKVGNVGTCNFYIKYDPAILSASKVAAGDIVVNAPVNFSSKINATAGTISFVFLDNTIGDELITTDGVLANITFNVLNSSAQVTNVSFSEGGAFGDGNMSKITDITYSNGSVQLK